MSLDKPSVLTVLIFQLKLAFFFPIVECFFYRTDLFFKVKGCSLALSHRKSVYQGYKLVLGAIYASAFWAKCRNSSPPW